MNTLCNSPALNKKPQGERRLRSYVNQNGWIRDYISPVGGALNTWWVIFVCMVKCLLSGIDKVSLSFEDGGVKNFPAEIPLT